MITRFLGPDPSSSPSILSQPDSQPTTDALLALGLVMSHQSSNNNNNPNFGDFPPDTSVKSYIWLLAILSATTPSPSLRYGAHSLATAVLHAHPDAALRLELIHNMLFDAPFPNLKVSAIGWLKDEILSASSPLAGNDEEEQQIDSKNVFLSPALLTRISPDLFPEIPKEQVLVNEPDSMAMFLSFIPLHMAVLNFYYLILSAPELREKLDIVRLHEKREVKERYLEKLRRVAGTAEVILSEQSEGEIREHFADVQGGRMELLLLVDMVGTVEEAVEKIDGGAGGGRRLLADAF